MESPGISLPTPLFHSAKRRRVGVALDDYLGVQIRLHCILKEECIEAGQVGRPVKSSRRQFERAGGPDTDAHQLLVRSALLQHAADRVAYIAHHRIGTFADTSG